LNSARDFFTQRRFGSLAKARQQLVVHRDRALVESAIVFTYNRCKRYQPSRHSRDARRGRHRHRTRRRAQSCRRGFARTRQTVHRRL
jgi:hypothetical protein